MDEAHGDQKVPGEGDAGEKRALLTLPPAPLTQVANSNEIELWQQRGESSLEGQCRPFREQVYGAMYLRHALEFHQIAFKRASRDLPCA